MRKRMNKQHGFSMLELMVVIVILGILASMVVPQVFGNKEIAERQKVKSDLLALEAAMDMYKLDNSRYPNTDQGLEALVSQPTISPEPRNYRKGGYIKRLPKDPWGSDYLMVSPGENGDYDIFSAGVDGEEGTDDDIGTWNVHDAPAE